MSTRAIYECNPQTSLLDVTGARTVRLSISRIGDQTVTMPEHEVNIAYAVTDQYDRKVGFLVRATHEIKGPTSVGWHINVHGSSSCFWFRTREEALDAIGVAWAGHLAASSPATFEVIL